MKGERTVLDVLRQLAEELRLPEGSEDRLRMLGAGNGEINAIIERNDDAQRVRTRSNVLVADLLSLLLLFFAPRSLFLGVSQSLLLTVQIR